MSAATADPVREQVEATLRQVVETVAAVPCEVARRARTATANAAERVTSSVAGPIGLVRSVAELAVVGLLGLGQQPTAPRPDRPPSALPVRPTDPAAAGTDDPGGQPDADVLPLEGYESLAASQVVARLARLAPNELEQVRAFELANRGRRTILGKIEQLLGR